MTLKAILFGSIGAIAETSEMQRNAFNGAFAEHGLDWHWDGPTYRNMLTINGGRNRLEHHAKQTGTDLDDATVAALHDTKTRLFDEAMKRDGLPLLPGVARLLAQAREAGLKTGFVTGTVRANIEALAQATGLDLDAFDIVTDKTSVDAEKPDPAIYRHACARLGIDPVEAVAIEDSGSSLRSAVDAGCITVAAPGANSGGQDFSAADLTVASLDDVELRDLQALAAQLRVSSIAAE